MHLFSISQKDQNRTCDVHFKTHIKTHLVNKRFKEIAQRRNHIDFILATSTLYIMVTIKVIDIEYNRSSNNCQ